MKAVILEQFGELDQLKMGNIPTPQPRANEVQIEVAYAGLNPVDWKVCAGLMRERMPYELPITLGWDVAGTVSKVGEKVTHFKVGDAVFAYARKAMIKDGTLAEYICLEEENVALKPVSIGFREAAVFPLAGLTAWQALFGKAKLRRDETVLIHAGAGGVGSMAIQFAKLEGARVVTTASKANHAYLKKLGATYVVDYHDADVIEQIQSVVPLGVDIIFDTVGGEALEASLEVIKTYGRVVSIRGELAHELAKKYKVTGSYLFVQPDGGQLKIIGDLIDEGKVVVPEIREFAFDKVKEGLLELKAGHVRGKIVVKV